jgi:hypothetical protein
MAVLPNILAPERAGRYFRQKNRLKQLQVSVDGPPSQSGAVTQAGAVGAKIGRSVFFRPFVNYFTFDRTIPGQAAVHRMAYASWWL